MVITIATGIFPPDIGGPATYSHRLAKALAARGDDVRVVTYSDRPTSQEGDQPFRLTRVSRDDVLPVRYLRYFQAIQRQSRASKGLYLLDAVGVGLPAAMASWRLGKPIVLRVVADFAWELAQLNGHRDSFEVFQEKRHGLLLETVRAVQERVAKRAERVIVPSRYMRDTLIRWGIEASRLTVIPNATDPAPISPTRDEARRRLGIEAQALLSAGRLIPLKGHDRLVEMMPALVDSIPGTTLYIAGSGPEEAKLRNKIDELRLHDVVHLVGSLEREQLLELYRACDLFILPSEHEAFPHVLLEAMAEGLVPVANSVGGVPEIVVDGVHGLLAPVDEPGRFQKAVSDLLSDPKRRAQLSCGARERARDFDWDETLIKTIEVLEAAFG